ncbi:hypothetical protein KC19_8G128700 [Ceratodon purpureus]|uniref:Uncharacterized protein n=1 Tax=Ceratodon purpureus TaxID=3225 RepID=A0A8T0H1Q3_CERPU|nr:hypothetical protein KC19_8G128700 [Ceratodon purpureus]
MESKENFLRRQLGWEFIEKKLKERVSAVVSSTRRMADCFSCLKCASVLVSLVCCCSSTLSLQITNKESDDEMKKPDAQKLGLSSIDAADGDDGKTKMTLLEYFEPGRLPVGVAHLRDHGLVPVGVAQLRNGWMSDRFAILRYGFVSMGVANLNFLGRVPKNIASLMIKSQREPFHDVPTPGNRVGADPTKSRIVIATPAVSQLPAQDIIDAAIDSVQVRVPDQHAVIVEVVAEEARLLGDDGLEVVLDVVEGITGTLERNEEDINSVVRATVNLGVGGDPIELGVLSPTEYTNLIFNVLLPQPMVDGVHH